MSINAGHSIGDLALPEALRDVLPEAVLQQVLQVLDARVRGLVERHVSKASPRLDEQPLWTPQDVQAYLRISARKLDYLIEDGEIVPIWIGRQRRFHPDAIRAYVRSAAVTPRR